MPTSPLSVVIQHLLADLRPDGDGMTDGELLARFLRSRDEDSLAALVRQHASMVWGVCRRLLNHHDAEDAFQATFLVLVRKAADVPREAVANWLYGVARQTAVRLRATAAKQGRRETQVVNMPEPTMPEVRDADLQRVVDEELSRLPDHYRGVVVLCDLEGMTRKAAARQLGIPEGSVASRLSRARAILAKRLAQRGVVISSGSVAAVFSAASASGSAPPALVASTIKTASLLAAGQAAGVVSAKVAALTEGVLKVMFVSKINAALSAVLILGVMATGTTLLTYRMAAGQNDKKPTVEKPVEPAAKQQKQKDKEAFTAWGKEVDGVQIGIQLGEQRVYTVGETATLIVRIRNNGKQEVPYSNGDFNGGEYFLRNPPLITTADGKPVKIKQMRPFTLIQGNSIAPGKEADLTKLSLALRSLTDREKDEAWTLYGTGKFHVQYNDVTVVGEARPDSGGLTITTGKLELEVKEADDKKPTIENPDKKPTVEKPVEPAGRQEERDLGKIEPPGGVPLLLVEPGTKKIGVDQLNKVSKRLESVPEKDLEQWVVELERIMDVKMKDGLPSPRQACRTDFVVHMSVAFDDLGWNTKAADKLYKRACTMPTKEATAWKEAFKSLLKKKIGIEQAGKDEFTNLAGGPPWAVPLALIPVDALHEGQKYSVERGKKYLARLKQLTKDDISLWSDKVDKFGGTELDAALNIMLLDEFFSKESFQRDKFKAAVERQDDKKPAAEKHGR
ncbi:MAG: hypothetical protein JWO38_1381 [Gemmataceae bacterium]|nr:hypothetical protein [Gemmataceae bacterium]